MEQKNRILVVIDMQNDFLTGSLGNYDFERVRNNVVEKIKSEDWDFIFLTRDTHGFDYLSTNEGKNLPVEHCIYGTPGWCIDSDVMDAVNYVHKQKDVNYTILDKNTFGSCELIDLLKMHVNTSLAEVPPIPSEITFIGVCTDICVVSNVLLAKACDDIRENCDIIVDAKCCSGVSKESHDAALVTMAACQAMIINK